MPRLILLLAVAITVVLLIRRVQALPPHKRRAGYLQLLFIGAAVAAVLLTLAGKMHWIGAALTGLLVAARQTFPVLIRAVPFLHQWWQRRQGPSGTQGQQSEVKSAILRMTLDHDTGELGGEVIAGPYREWQLDEMNREQLLELLAYCRDHDADSEQLLVGYLEQRFPDGYDPEGSDSSTRTNGDAGGGMNRQEALSILGLGAEATESDIVQAHRSLIQKLHPDRGGNDYLAAKINEAKDYLLKS